MIIVGFWIYVFIWDLKLVSENMRDSVSIVKHKRRKSIKGY